MNKMNKLTEILMYEVEGIASSLETLKNKLKRTEAFRKQIEEAGAFDKLSIYSNIYYNEVSHEETLQIIKAWGGKWDKRVEQDCSGSDYMVYSQCFTMMDDGRVVVEITSAPPSACQIVEVEEEVPARPAGVRKVRKIKCPEVVTKNEEEVV